MIEAFILTSPAFLNGAVIPALYTCDGENTSPQLDWQGAPPGTASLALVCDDPDAPGGTWTHWVVFNIPASSESLPEAVPWTPVLDDGSVQGLNSWGETGWGGPCPPSGTHRYVFRLYALDILLEPAVDVTISDLRNAMRGHTLGSASLTGLYSRSR
jgi:hypothetical protein